MCPCHFGVHDAGFGGGLLNHGSRYPLYIYIYINNFTCTWRSLEIFDTIKLCLRAKGDRLLERSKRTRAPKAPFQPRMRVPTRV